MAAEEPGEGQIKGCRSNDQAGKNEKLHKEARVDGKSGVVVSEPACHSHDTRTQGGLSEGSQYLHRSHSPVAQTKNNKKREEIKKAGDGCRQRGTPILHALEEELQKNDVQQNVDAQRNRRDYDGCFRISSRIKGWHYQLYGCQRRQTYGVVEQSSCRQTRRLR